MHTTKDVQETRERQDAEISFFFLIYFLDLI